MAARLLAGGLGVGRVWVEEELVERQEGYAKLGAQAVPLGEEVNVVLVEAGR